MMDFGECSSVIIPYSDNSKIYIMSSTMQSNMSVRILFVYV